VVPSAVGAIVLVRFPFSDLSQTKLRPAVVLAHPSPEDWILGQITSNRYGDTAAIELTAKDMTSGSLHRQSFFRPGKIFTAHRTLISAEVAVLTDKSIRQAIKSVIALLERGQP
jgi:hypothetical protein